MWCPCRGERRRNQRKRRRMPPNRVELNRSGARQRGRRRAAAPPQMQPGCVPNWIPTSVEVPSAPESPKTLDLPTLQLDQKKI
jgi:hypothetical protein